MRSSILDRKVYIASEYSYCELNKLISEEEYIYIRQDFLF